MAMRMLNPNKSRMERCSKREIGTKETYDTGDPRPHLEVKKSNACRGRENFGALQFVCFTGTLLLLVY